MRGLLLLLLLLRLSPVCVPKEKKKRKKNGPGASQWPPNYRRRESFLHNAHLHAKGVAAKLCPEGSCVCVCVCVCVGVRTEFL